MCKEKKNLIRILINQRVNMGVPGTDFQVTMSLSVIGVYTKKVKFIFQTLC